jgi:FkbM family methyltransferase
MQRMRKNPRKILYSRFMEPICLHLDKPIRVKAKTFWGADILVVIPEVVSLKIYRNGFFEEGLTRMILEYLRPGMTFFDIGAHVGYFSLLASTIVGNEGQVHSFEPTPTTFDVLRFNTKDKNNIHINDTGVFSKRTTILFNDYGIRASAYNSIYQGRLRESMLKTVKVRRHEIRTISLDEYMDTHKVAPDFIKIDVESAEYEVLRGMERTLDRTRPMISIEVGDKGVGGVAYSRDIIVYLMERGYRSYEFKGGKIVKHELTRRYAYNNILFVPK